MTNRTVALIFLIGLPGSGKSSFAARLVEECPERYLISTDMIRSHLFGSEDIQGPWLKVFSEVGQQFRQAVQLIQQEQAIAAIYDATNVVRKQRREALALARESGFTHITGIWLNVPLWLCLKRNQTRDRQVPPEVIQRMSQRLCAAPPSEQEDLDQLFEVQPWNRAEARGR